MLYLNDIDHSVVHIGTGTGCENWNRTDRVISQGNVKFIRVEIKNIRKFVLSQLP